MPDDLPTNDPRKLWKDQPTEVFQMSADELRRQVRRLQARARLEVAKAILFGALLAGFFAWRAALAHQAMPRAGFVILSLWSVHLGYQTYRSIWTRRLLPDATEGATLQSYKQALERRRDYVRHLWRRAGLTFCLAGAALVVAPAMLESLHDPRFLWRWAPLFALVVLWFAVFFPMRKRRQQRLQKELDELRLLEG